MWGCRLDHVQLFALKEALSSGQTEFTKEQLENFAVGSELLKNLEEDFCWMDVGGTFWEPAPADGTMLCPLCMRAWLTVTSDGVVSRCVHSRRGAKGVACGCAKLTRVHVDAKLETAPLELLRAQLKKMGNRKARAAVASEEARKISAGEAVVKARTRPLKSRKTSAVPTQPDEAGSGSKPHSQEQQ